LKGLRVLIVEDELIIAMELERLLGRLGCVVLDARSAVPPNSNPNARRMSSVPKRLRPSGSSVGQPGAA
jgi:hypothetical protein